MRDLVWFFVVCAAILALCVFCFPFCIYSFGCISLGKNGLSYTTKELAQDYMQKMVNNNEVIPRNYEISFFHNEARKRNNVITEKKVVDNTENVSMVFTKVEDCGTEVIDLNTLGNNVNIETSVLLYPSDEDTKDFLMRFQSHLYSTNSPRSNNIEIKESLDKLKDSKKKLRFYQNGKTPKCFQILVYPFKNFSNGFLYVLSTLSCCIFLHRCIFVQRFKKVDFIIKKKVTIDLDTRKALIKNNLHLETTLYKEIFEEKTKI